MLNSLILYHWDSLFPYSSFFLLFIILIGDSVYDEEEEE